LYNNKMEWWSSEGGRYNAQSECKGSIDLSTVHAVEHVSYDAFTKAHMFQIVHTSLLYIQCNTKSECLQWVETLRQLIRANTFLHPKYHPGFFEDKDRVWSCCGIPNREFKGCLGACDYTQMPDGPVTVPVATQPVVARPEPSATVASAAQASASKPLAVAHDASARAQPAAKHKATPAVSLGSTIACTDDSLSTGVGASIAREPETCREWCRCSVPTASKAWLSRAGQQGQSTKVWSSPTVSRFHSCRVIVTYL
jgi:hypothetical protein